MKKLLAIVMVVAMMFSMSIIANADATADIAYADGVATITVYDSQIQTVDFGVVYPEGVTCKTAKWSDGWKNANGTLIEDGDYTVSGIGNKAATDAAGNTYAVYTAACMVSADGSPIPYEGDILTFVFEGVTEGTEFVVVTGTASADDVKANTVATLVAEVPATPEPEVTPEPSDDPIVEPSDDPIVEPSDDPIVEPSDDPIVEPSDDANDDKKDETPATTKPADDGKKPAPQTADVAPVATMITLVVVAGLAIVALKKRATN